MFGVDPDTITAAAALVTALIVVAGFFRSRWDTPTVKLRVFEAADIGDGPWIGIEINNEGPQDITVRNLQVRSVLGQHILQIAVRSYPSRSEHPGQDRLGGHNHVVWLIGAASLARQLSELRLGKTALIELKLEVIGGRTASTQVKLNTDSGDLIP